MITTASTFKRSDTRTPRGGEKGNLHFHLFICFSFEQRRIWAKFPIAEKQKTSERRIANVYKALWVFFSSVSSFICLLSFYLFLFVSYLFVFHSDSSEFGPNSRGQSNKDKWAADSDSCGSWSCLHGALSLLFHLFPHLFVSFRFVCF